MHVQPVLKHTHERVHKEVCSILRPETKPNRMSRTLTE